MGRPVSGPLALTISDMDPVLSVLEARGLVSFEAVDKFVDSWSFQDVRRVQDELQSALEKQSAEVPSPASLDPFNFVASASMRGDAGCVNWDCRLRKNSLLARYAALYSDTTVVPLPIGLCYSDEDEYDLRRLLGGTILCVQQLRPLLDAGIVKFAQQEYQYCDQHLYWRSRHTGGLPK